MPLAKGSSKATVKKNIHEMVASGHSVKQSVAAALHTAHPKGGKASDEVLSTTAMTLADINAQHRKYWDKE
jgi:hypothetical protein